MSGPLYVIAGLLATAAIAGVGYIIREYLRLSVEVGKERAETEAQTARGDRILKEKQSEERIHSNRPISDFDNSRRL
jgi:hypothetical protein